MTVDGWLAGVIGGSGLYKLDNLTVIKTISVVTVSAGRKLPPSAPRRQRRPRLRSAPTAQANPRPRSFLQPWGATSSPITIAALPVPNGPSIPIAFIARHGLHHSIPPSSVPARANIAALKHLGCRAVVAFSAVGSLREEVRPGDLVVPDQIIDRTKGIRPSTFFDGSMVGHAMFGDPFTTGLSGFVVPHVRAAIESFGERHINPSDPPRLHEGKTVVVMEGPQFSTRAESEMYRQWGGDIINMSSIPEAKLAREAELA